MATSPPRDVPRHVACVMDGNGRWAQQRGLPRTEGHKRGEHSLFDVVHGAIDLGIEWLTVYAFSTENWKRPPGEVKFLINFNDDILLRRQDELNEMNVHLRFVGRRDRRVPKRLIRRMDEASALTANNTGLKLTIAFNYGGRAEIIDAVRDLAAQGHDLASLDERTLAANLYDPDMPDVDLMVRTSGEYRTSNFLIWQLAYSEMWFTETLWPDFSAEELGHAVYDYQHRQRRYGGVKT